MRPSVAAGGLLPVYLAGLIGCSQQDASSRRASEQADSLSLPASTSPLDSLIAAGQKLYLRGAYDSARAIWLPALEKSREERDSTSQARILTSLGLAAYRQGDYDEATRLGETALSIGLALDAEGELARSYNLLGLVAWNEGRLSDAVDLYGAATRSARAAGDSTMLAVAAQNLGLVHTDLGNFAEARAGFEQMREVSHVLGDARREGIALNNLGMLSKWIGNPGGAIAPLTEARRLFKSVNYPEGEQNALGQLGTAYAALGEPGLAIASLDSALILSRMLGSLQEEASNLEALAAIHLTAGDHRRALTLYAQAESINAEVGLALETGSDQRMRANIYASLGNTRLAMESAKRALETHRQAQAHFEELKDLIFLADLAHQAGDDRESSNFLAAARRLTRELDTRRTRVAVALTDARIADRSERPQRILRVLEEASADLVRGGYDEEWEAEVLRARAYARLEMLDSAAAAGRRAVAAVEHVRRNFGSEVLRTAYAAEKLDAYLTLVTVLLETDEAEEAFEVADAARGRTLIERLSETRSDSFRPGAAASTLVGGENLLRRISTLIDRLDEIETLPQGERDSAIAKRQTELYNKLQQARADYELLLIRASEGDAEGTALLGGRHISASEVRSALRPAEALIEYLISADRLITFVVTRDGIASLVSEISFANLSRRVRLVRDLLGRPDGDSTALNAVLEGLHTVLLYPALQRSELAGIHHIIIVPHGVLNYLPFAALIDGKTRRYLSEDYSVRLLPSSAALPVLRLRSSAKPRALRPGDVFAPFPRALPATRIEARAAKEALPDSRAIVGGDATERRVRQALAAPKIVHISTHGVLNSRNPMFSRIELAQGRAYANDDDGRLEVHELLEISVRSPLVFLSGCETGLGVAWSTDFSRGEDYATLAQAFLYAGAQNVIATLWRIEDEGSATFAERFYRELQKAPPFEALALAQRGMMSDPRFSSPYYWAPYQLVGNGEL